MQNFIILTLYKIGIENYRDGTKNENTNSAKLCLFSQVNYKAFLRPWRRLINISAIQATHVCLEDWPLNHPKAKAFKQNHNYREASKAVCFSGLYESWLPNKTGLLFSSLQIQWKTGAIKDKKIKKILAKNLQKKKTYSYRLAIPNDTNKETQK